MRLTIELDVTDPALIDPDDPVGGLKLMADIHLRGSLQPFGEVVDISVKEDT